MPQPILPDTQALRNALGDHADSVAITLLDSVDSTNNIAKAAAQDHRPALYVARTQTGGRGRLGRSFFSPADTGLYMTVAFTTEKPLAEIVGITAKAAVVTVAAIEALTNLQPGIKWVNDIYLEHRKIGGILTEAVTLPDQHSRIIVGLGLNLTTRDFPDGLRAPASCLFSADEASAVTPAFLGSLIGKITKGLLDTVNGTADPAELLAFYRQHLIYRGETVTCTRGSDVFEGVLAGVDDTYSLLVTVNQTTHVLSSGEISVRPGKKF